MSSKIRISEQHGLNPSINVCFFCGKDKELKLFGKLKGDAKAPTRIVADYKPCKECEEKMRRGATIIEVTREDSGTQPIGYGAWPTGRWCVISKEAAEKLFKKPVSTMLLDKPLYEKLTEATKK